jgi:circadian clock protein KaiB
MTTRLATNRSGVPAAESPPGQQYRLYVTAGSPISSKAVVNARKFFEAHLPGKHRLSVLDIGLHVALARADQIIASPTLIRLLPLPQRRFIGDMSDTARLCASLGIEPGPDA